MAYSLIDEYSFLDDHMSIAVVPVKDLSITEKYVINNIHIYPKHSLDTEIIQGCIYNFDFLEIKELFYDSTIITFPIASPQTLILSSLMPSVKDKLMKSVINQTEDIINVFRYIFCNIDKSSNLPQRAGYIKENTSGFLLFSFAMKGATYISGKNYITSQTIGNGLFVDLKYMRPSIDHLFYALYQNDTLVSNIIKHAIRLYSDILYMPTSTNKFMQSMTLIDYLGNPFEFQKMQINKSKIAPFSADSHAQYNLICERFKYLTSQKDSNDNQIGLRTNIIHNGKSIDELIFDGYEIDLILKEIQLYICNFINGILDYSDQNDWTYIETKIEEKRNSILAIPTGYTGRFECDSVVIIDFDFFNKALQEVYQLYPQYKQEKFDIEKFLYLVLKQSDIHRPNYQIPVNFVYSENSTIYNSTKDLTLDQYEGLGFESPDGEVSIYTMHVKEKYQEFLSQTFENVISEKNYFFNDGTKYTNIVLISDYNEIPDKYFVKANNSCKTIILGRLDNKRTRCYDSCLYFDITYLIMTTLNIPLHEDCEGTFIFDKPRYPDA